ncbi:MAG TPA: 2-oxo acid dehydrogenase subunit E2 [Candidatus Scatomorpha pullistercoris]|uniref:2-oxo acid dehydrogenase subunit E2 n=1 Tax=Candidatus Scatomorpha pullistercoris TaxID=2840929 RepID=A0A9D1K8K5_9FIRM|nr:2-oxo acid dehydrogenase subunit E2 [Candidatus Scatomorpha pullistercoris]
MSTTGNRRRIGDRKEGRRLRTLPALNLFTPYIMIDRNDACNQFAGFIEISETDRWLRAKRQEGYKGLGMLHLFIAAYIRVISQLPGLNRFVAGQKIYARNEILINMMVKRGITTDSEETCAKVVFEPTDTIYDVYRKMNDAVEEIRASDDSGTEKVAGALMKIPGLFLKFAVWILKIMDYFDLIPMSLLRASPFHGSMIVTDLGSLGIPPIYHHIYNFGNLPVFLAFGAKRRVMELDRHGNPVERKYVDYKIVCDERIVDGAYYAAAFKFMKYYLKNPNELERAPEKVVEDIF